MAGNKPNLTSSGAGRMRRIFASVILAATLISSTLPAAAAFADQPPTGAIVAISEAHSPDMPDDDDGTAAEKEELITSNEEVPEGVDSTEDGIVLKGSAPLA